MSLSSSASSSTNNRLTTCLWFDGNASEAAKFYTNVFPGPNTSILQTSLYADSPHTTYHGHEPGSVMVVEFQLQGHRFAALNGGPEFKFNPSISFQIDCADQSEVDYFWDALGTKGGGEDSVCGWLHDKFGVSWQVIPRRFKELIADQRDQGKYRRIMDAMTKMAKLDVAELEKAVAE
jgi:predicted 3-demethylubiquinone-9 3-methyltransferase (glyoxalase superfamily)